MHVDCPTATVAIVLARIIGVTSSAQSTSVVRMLPSMTLTSRSALPVLVMQRVTTTGLVVPLGNVTGQLPEPLVFRLKPLVSVRMMVQVRLVGSTTAVAFAVALVVTPVDVGEPGPVPVAATVFTLVPTP